MTFREAKLTDIDQLSVLRLSVKENQLSNPDLIAKKDYETYLSIRGKGWVTESNGQVVGFSIVDLQEHNIWALFIKPGFEGLGIGRGLHHLMLEWYFSQTKETVWLSTAPQTRAEKFYRKAGWQETGLYGKGEIRFEMPYQTWLKLNLSLKAAE